MATELGSLGLKNCFREVIFGLGVAGPGGAAVAVRIFESCKCPALSRGWAFVSICGHCNICPVYFVAVLVSKISNKFETLPNSK